MKPATKFMTVRERTRHSERPIVVEYGERPPGVLNDLEP